MPYHGAAIALLPVGILLTICGIMGGLLVLWKARKPQGKEWLALALAALAMNTGLVMGLYGIMPWSLTRTIVIVTLFSVSLVGETALVQGWRIAHARQKTYQISWGAMLAAFVGFYAFVMAILQA